MTGFGTLPPARRAALVVIAAAGTLLGGALIAQHAFGLAPCEMCLWQRWPHGTALVLATLALVVGPDRARPLVIAAVAGVALSGLIGLFHAGVEYGWWAGLSQCAAGPSGAGSSSLDAVLGGSVIRCDAAPWTLLGVSLAGFNGVLSLLGAWLAGRCLRSAPTRAGTARALDAA